MLSEVASERGVRGQAPYIWGKEEGSVGVCPGHRPPGSSGGRWHALGRETARNVQDTWASPTTHKAGEVNGDRLPDREDLVGHPADGDVGSAPPLAPAERELNNGVLREGIAQKVVQPQDLGLRVLEFHGLGLGVQCTEGTHHHQIMRFLSCLVKSSSSYCG